MVKLICQRATCKHCLYEQCENVKIKDEFKNVETVTKVLLSISSDSCKEYEEDKSLIDAHS